MRTLVLSVFGIVQAVGFRPYVHRLAKRHHFLGTVANKGSFVEIYLQTEAPKVREAEELFIEALKNEAPERSMILRINEDIVDLAAYDDFQIIASAHEEGDIFVSPDIGICEACSKELFDVHNRRYLHPFINCTACGPRLTILDSMPYDRERTSMKVFPMCPACHEEYTTPTTRRFDAQPVCCNDCGPTVFLDGEDSTGLAAMSKAIEALLADEIVAIKGIGGFHLCCNAHSDEAVAKLRLRKRRPTKPFAVMCKDLSCVRSYCVVNEHEAKALQGFEKPIVLLERRKEPLQAAAGRTPLSELLAPDNPNLGVMLPYTPLHLLLFGLPDYAGKLDCLVMTSGNISGAPICHTTALARKELSQITDHVLTHNRAINLRSDDSVLEVYEEHPVLLRRSRGFAPLPIHVHCPSPKPILAIGAELKNTFCLAQNELFYLSPHVGDLGDIRTIAALEESIARLSELLRITPEVVACDLHPNYNSSRVAKEMGIPVQYVQHHYAHILSCLAEHNRKNKVLGLAFDGTGYGSDGTIWGGEILEAAPNGFRRLASIAPFPQSGGDLAVREGNRIALGMLLQLFGCDEGSTLAEKLSLYPKAEAQLLMEVAARKINTVTSTSAGRLFDAASALLGICRESSYEGEAAMRLEWAAESELTCSLKKGDALYELWAKAEEAFLPQELERQCDVLKQKTKQTAVDAPLLVLPTDRVIGELIQKKLNQTSSAQLALFFHLRLASLLACACLALRSSTDLSTVALSGGVFQNRLLRTLVQRILVHNDFEVLLQERFPTNDGGLCLGQAYAAAVHTDN